MNDTAVKDNDQTETPDVEGVAGDTGDQVTENNAVAESKEEEVDLEALLSEFDGQLSNEPSGNEDSADSSHTPDDDEPLTRKDIDKLFEAREREASYKKQADDDISSAVSTVKGELDIPDKWVRGILEMEALEDPRFATAFTARHDKPDAWNKILKAKSKEVSGYFQAQESSKKVADDVNAAVHSATTKAPQPKDDMTPMEALQKLGPSKFEVWKKARFASKGR